MVRTFWVVIIWHLPVAIQSDSDLAVLGCLEFLAVQLHGGSMRKEEAVADAKGRRPLVN